MNNTNLNQFRPYTAIFYYALKALTRSRSTLFFGFAFPLIFILGFGLINNQDINLTLGLITKEANNPLVSVIEKVDGISLEKGSRDSLEKKLTAGQLTGLLIVNEGDLELMLSEANPTEKAILTSVITGLVDKTNLAVSGIKNPPLQLKIVSVEGRQFRYIDFFLPGMIGFALLTTAVTGISFGLIFLKKTLVLKRIFATPIQGLTILLGQGSARLVIALAQTILIVGVGTLFLHFTLINGWLTFFQVLILSIFGLVSFLGFGLFIAGIVSDENAAAPLSQLIVLPQFLVAGTFFPIEALPSWLQPIVSLLPLAFFNTAIRKITLEGMGIGDIAPELLGLAVWSIIAYLAAAKTFKWE